MAADYIEMGYDGEQSRLQEELDKQHAEAIGGLEVYAMQQEELESQNKDTVGVKEVPKVEGKHKKKITQI